MNKVEEIIFSGIINLRDLKLLKQYLVLRSAKQCLGVCIDKEIPFPSSISEMG